MQEKYIADEQKWLKIAQAKFMKYITNAKWDNIILSSIQYNTISAIMSAKKVKELPPTINERVVDILFEIIENKFKKVKLTSRTK